MSRIQKTMVNISGCSHHHAVSTLQLTELSHLPVLLEIKDKSTKKQYYGASLVVQWLVISLAMQGTWVQSLVQEDPVCHRAINPVCHNS